MYVARRTIVCIGGMFIVGVLFLIACNSRGDLHPRLMFDLRIKVRLNFCPQFLTYIARGSYCTGELLSYFYPSLFTRGHV